MKIIGMVRNSGDVPLLCEYVVSSMSLYLCVVTANYVENLNLKPSVVVNSSLVVVCCTLSFMLLRQKRS